MARPPGNHHSLAFFFVSLREPPYLVSILLCWPSDFDGHRGVHLVTMKQFNPTNVSATRWRRPVLLCSSRTPFSLRTGCPGSLFEVRLTRPSSVAVTQKFQGKNMLNSLLHRVHRATVQLHPNFRVDTAVSSHGTRGQGAHRGSNAKTPKGSESEPHRLDLGHSPTSQFLRLPFGVVGVHTR